MRTYVVLCNPHTNPIIVGVVSSKRNAVTACEELLSQETDGELVWERMEKDSGIARRGEMVATFQRHMLNDI